MSKHRQRPPRRPEPGRSEVVWVRADPTPLGAGYMLTVEFTDDDVLPLSGADMLAYVATLSDALARAQYAEAVRRQLREQFTMREDMMMHTIIQLRDSWPDLRRFGRYEIRPCVSMEGRTSVDVWLGDRNLVQFSPDQLREHIAYVLRVYAWADLDSAYRRFLVGQVGIDQGAASLCVSTLNRHVREE
jgi:hypothetical protein